MFPKFFAHSPLRQAVGDVIAHVRIRSVRSHVVNFSDASDGSTDEKSAWVKGQI